MRFSVQKFIDQLLVIISRVDVFSVKIPNFFDNRGDFKESRKYILINKFKKICAYFLLA